MVLVKGAMEDIVRQNCRAIGKDSAVSSSITGMMLKMWAATTPVRPTTESQTGGHRLATDSAGGILMEGAPPHDRTINVAAMMHNSEVHDQEMLADIIIIGMIPCSKCVPPPSSTPAPLSSVPAPTQLCITISSSSPSLCPYHFRTDN